MFLTGICLFLLAITLHELGHAFVLRRYGIRMSEISLLGFGPRIVTFKLRKWFNDVPISIRMIPLGAFVKRDEKDVDKFTYKQKMEYLSGGICANFLYGSVLFLIGSTLEHHFYIQPLILFVALPAIIGLSPKFSWRLVPMIGILLLSYLIWLIYHEGLHQFNKENGSIISIGFILKDILNWSKLFKVCGLLSIGLGLMNSLPISILDGGKIAAETLGQLFSKASIRKNVIGAYIAVTSLPFVYLVCTAVFNDILLLFRR